MPISFTCPHCGRQTTVADQYAGQSGPCAGCARLITIPGDTTSGNAIPGDKSDTAPQFAAPPSSRGSTPGWVVAMVVVGAVAGLCLCGGGVLLIPAMQKTRQAAERVQCMANLRNIGLAMQQYQQQYGTFPPAYVADENGRPKHSWRALLLPYLDPGLSSQYNYDEPWDGPNNSQLASQMPAVFACSSRPPSTSGGETTSYVVINAPGAIFEGPKASGFAGIQDGLSNTILVVEATEVDIPIPWMEPRDLNPQQMNLMLGTDDIGITSPHPGGANILMADGSVHFLPSTTPAQEVHALITAAGGEPVVVP